MYVVYDGQYGDHPIAEDMVHDNAVPLVIPNTVLNFVGPATFLFTSHYCILSMGAEALQES